MKTKNEFLLAGYNQMFDEIQSWIKFREDILIEAWQKLGFIMVGLTAQAGVAWLPFVTIIGYAYPWYVDVLIKRWNRYNFKVGEKVKIRRQIEDDLKLNGVEMLGSTAPSAGVRPQSQAEFGKINLTSITLATIAWLVRVQQYSWLVSVICGIGLVAVCVKSWRSIHSIVHSRS